MNEMTLMGLLETVWDQLIRGTTDANHPARTPTLATIGPDGPELRTLILRKADRAAARLELHTDAASSKVGEIGRDPRVALHVWIPDLQLQIRASGRAEVTPGDAAAFADLPPEAQANYGGPVPGEALGDRDPYDIIQGDPSRFSRILIELSRIDAVLLTHPHRRALYRAGHHWVGEWFVP